MGCPPKSGDGHNERNQDVYQGVEVPKLEEVSPRLTRGTTGHDDIAFNVANRDVFILKEVE
jgi:hypothetical protein